MSNTGFPIPLRDEMSEKTPPCPPWRISSSFCGMRRHYPGHDQLSYNTTPAKRPFQAVDNSSFDVNQSNNCTDKVGDESEELPRPKRPRNFGEGVFNKPPLLSQPAPSNAWEARPAPTLPSPWLKLQPPSIPGLRPCPPSFSHLRQFDMGESTDVEHGTRNTSTPTPSTPTDEVFDGKSELVKSLMKDLTIWLNSAEKLIKEGEVGPFDDEVATAGLALSKLLWKRFGPAGKGGQLNEMDLSHMNSDSDASSVTLDGLKEDPRLYTGILADPEWTSSEYSGRMTPETWHYEDSDSEWVPPREQPDSKAPEREVIYLNDSDVICLGDNNGVQVKRNETSAGEVGVGKEIIEISDSDTDDEGNRREFPETVDLTQDDMIDDAQEGDYAGDYASYDATRSPVYGRGNQSYGIHDNFVYGEREEPRQTLLPPLELHDYTRHQRGYDSPASPPDEFNEQGHDRTGQEGVGAETWEPEYEYQYYPVHDEGDEPDPEEDSLDGYYYGDDDEDTTCEECGECGDCQNSRMAAEMEHGVEQVTVESDVGNDEFPSELGGEEPTPSERSYLDDVRDWIESTVDSGNEGVEYGHAEPEVDNGPEFYYNRSRIDVEPVVDAAAEFYYNRYRLDEFRNREAGWFDRGYVLPEDDDTEHHEPTSTGSSFAYSGGRVYGADAGLLYD